MKRAAAWVAALLLAFGAVGTLVRALPTADTGGAPTLAEFSPTKGLFAPGEEWRFTLKLTAPAAARGTYRLEVRPYSGITALPAFTRRVDLNPAADGTQTASVTWAPPAQAAAAGIGLDVRLLDNHGHEVGRATTAADAAANWAERPRYGFLTDFSPDDGGQQGRFAQMAAYHLNGLQVYDWMVSHADYVPTTETYKDPLGRPMSRSVLLEKLNLARSHGMAPIAYTAIYAAPVSFYQQHPDWALLDPAGKPYQLGENFLRIMDPSAGSPWRSHILDQYRRIVQELPFAGVQLDQYGDPKTGTGAWSHKKIALAAELPGFLADAGAAVAQGRPGATAIFNNVGNWSTPFTAKATGNAMVYIEVWPPYTKFGHLAQLVADGRRLSDGKPVVLAAYTGAGNRTQVLLTDATIFAAGGSHIELGEGNAVLGDPYFPRYQSPADTLATALGRYYDFAVQNRSLLTDPAVGPWDGDAPELSVPTSDGYSPGVWPLVRSTPAGVAVHLINLAGQSTVNWTDINRLRPAVPQNLTLALPMPQSPKAAWLLSPDRPDAAPVPLPVRYQNGKATVDISGLTVWDLVLFTR